MKPRLERIPEFISKEEQKTLIDWIDEKLSKGEIPFGYTYDRVIRNHIINKKRRTTRVSEKPIDFPQVAYDTQKRLLDTFEWTDNCRIEPICNGNKESGMIVIATFPGGDTHKHRDSKVILGRSATRFNIILQKPESGGELYVEGENFACDERELHCYNVTDNTHWVTEVQGDKPRYIWIFGMSIPQSDWENGKVSRKT